MFVKFDDSEAIAVFRSEKKIVNRENYVVTILECLNDWFCSQLLIWVSFVEYTVCDTIYVGLQFRY